MLSANEVILGIGLFSSVSCILRVDCISSIGYILSVDSKIIVFWDK